MPGTLLITAGCEWWRSVTFCDPCASLSLPRCIWWWVACYWVMWKNVKRMRYTFYQWVKRDKGPYWKRLKVKKLSGRSSDSSRVSISWNQNMGSRFALWVQNCALLINCVALNWPTWEEREVELGPERGRRPLCVRNRNPVGPKLCVLAWLIWHRCASLCRTKFSPSWNYFGSCGHFHETPPPRPTSHR